LKIFMAIQSFVVLIGVLILAETLDNKGAASFFIGGLLILLNVWALTFVWKRIIQKKFIALPVSVIVFKYAILGLIIYQVSKVPWLNPLCFSAGLGSLIVTTGLYLFFIPKDEVNNEEPPDNQQTR